MDVNIGNRIIRLGETGSTNSHVHHLVSQGRIRHGNVVIASKQSSGRGQGENTWTAEPGKNLTASVYVEPLFLPPDRQFFITIFVTLGLHDLLSNYVQDVSIKWPNDILIGNRKIAGVLIENTISGNSIAASVLGIGLNVNQVVFPSEVSNATSLRLVLGNDVNTEDILSGLLERLDSRYAQMKQSMYREMKKEYLDHLYLYDQVVNYKTVKGNLTGKISDVLDTGELVFHPQGKAGSLLFSFKEIEFPVT